MRRWLPDSQGLCQDFDFDSRWNGNPVSNSRQRIGMSCILKSSLRLLFED